MITMWSSLLLVFENYDTVIFFVGASSPEGTVEIVKAPKFEINWFCFDVHSFT